MQKEAEVDMDGGAMVDMHGREMVRQKEFEVTEMDPEPRILYVGGEFYTRGRFTVDEFVRAPGFHGMNVFLRSGRALIVDYLIRKVRNEPLPPVEITEEPNVFNCDPQDLSKNYYLDSGRQPMYFFHRRNKMDLEESRFLKEDNVDGFWKISKADIPVKDKEENGGRIIGFKNRLVFCGPTKLEYDLGPNTKIPYKWRMSEYRLNEEEEGSVSSGIELDRWVICKIFMDQDRDERLDPFYWDDWYYSGESEDYEK